MLRKIKRQPNDNLSLIEHLQELRRRIMISVLFLIIGVAGGFYFADRVLDRLLTIPGDLVYLYPGEAFFAYIKIAFVLGLLVASPILVYQVLAFIMPGLKKKEQRTLLIGLPFAGLLFGLGVFFSYQVILPIAYQFFMGFATDSLEPLISVGSYISFVLGLVLPFGFVFQMPLLVIILTAVGILSPHFLRRNRKFMILIVFTVSAFLTPPDIISQTLMAGPLLLLYEFSILLSHVAFWRRKKQLDLD